MMAINLDFNNKTESLERVALELCEGDTYTTLKLLFCATITRAVMQGVTTENIHKAVDEIIEGFATMQAEHEATNDLVTKH